MGIILSLVWGMMCSRWYGARAPFGMSPTTGSGLKTATRELNPKPPKTTAAPLAVLLLGCVSRHQAACMQHYTNTTNKKKRHEAHWTGFEPKITTKRETSKHQTKQEHKTTTRELNPKSPETTAASLAVLLLGCASRKRARRTKHISGSAIAPGSPVDITSRRWDDVIATECEIRVSAM